MQESLPLTISFCAMKDFCRTLRMLIHVCCFSERANWERPGNMRVSRKAPSQCDITLQTFFVFFFFNQTFYKREKKEFSGKTAALNYTVLLTPATIQQHFFYISPSVFLLWGKEPTYRGKNICFMTFFALFHGIFIFLYLECIKTFCWERKLESWKRTETAWGITEGRRRTMERQWKKYGINAETWQDLARIVFHCVNEYKIGEWRCYQKKLYIGNSFVLFFAHSSVHNHTDFKQ